jgi:asparagine synthase (glutamine-hydrolysing)
MCGIYGFAATSGDLGAPAEVDRVLARMDRAIFHRGPDENGTYVDSASGGRCAIGMRRLSIIDLGGGRQPIHDEARRVWVVFNGEIYNYRALRAELEARGHRFYTSSDTEVIVHLYEDRGDAFVEALDGMFAIALWDRASATLVLARDRLGIKPLYFAETKAALVFGSELKAVVQHPAVARRVSPEALSYYLSFGATPGGQSILDGVRKLEAGHLLRFHRGQVSVRRYWDLRPPPRAHVPSFAEAVAEVRSLVRTAVKSHLVADVPVGAFLSGGIDSATVVGTMVELGARPKTFSIGFDEREYDELEYARLIAKTFDTDHHELVVRPDAWDLVERLPWFLDEPFADVSAIPTYLVSKLAAAQVKVVLSGDGGDEVFAGYERYPHALAEAKLDGLPAWARRALALAARVVPPITPGKNWMHHASLPPRLRFVDMEAMFSLNLKRALVVPELWAAHDPFESRAQLLERAPGDALGRLLYYDTMTYLPFDILTKVDRMTMAHSLEARPPLLDHHLVEACFTLPSEFKLRRGSGTVTQKAVLKAAVRDLLPRAILDRPKRGFGVPIEQWFRGPLREAVADILTSTRSRGRGWLEPRFVRALIDEHRSGRRDQSLRMWSLLMLEQWCRRFLDVVPDAFAAPVPDLHVPPPETAHG